MGIGSYCTREDVMSAPDIKAVAYMARRIDDACESSARKVDLLLKFGDQNTPAFGQWTGTRYYPYPNAQNASLNRLWLDGLPILSLASLMAGGVSVPSGSVFLEPKYFGPPYNRIEIDRNSPYTFAMNPGTAQRALALTGVWGVSDREEAAGILTADAGVNSISVTPDVGRRPFGVGDMLRIGNERMLVTEKSWASSGQAGSLAAAMNAQSLTVSDTSAFMIGEELLIEAERLMVRDIAGSTLYVQRAWGGSTLAAHSGATVYWPRTLTVERAALGTGSAAHTMGTEIMRQVIPGPVRSLSIAYTLDEIFQQSSGYARTVGQGDAERQASGRAIRDLESAVLAGYGRQIRMRAV